MKYELNIENDELVLNFSMDIDGDTYNDVFKGKKLVEKFDTMFSSGCSIKEVGEFEDRKMVITNENEMGAEIVIPWIYLEEFDSHLGYMPLNEENIALYNKIRNDILMMRPISMINNSRVSKSAAAAHAGVMEEPKPETFYMSKKDLADFIEKARTGYDIWADKAIVKLKENSSVLVDVLEKNVARAASYTSKNVKDFISEKVTKKTIVQLGAACFSVIALTTSAGHENVGDDINTPEPLNSYEIRYLYTKLHQLINANSNLGKDINKEEYKKIVSFIESSTGQKIKQSADLHGIDPYVMYAISNYMTNLNENVPFSVYADGRVSIGTDAETGLDTYGHLKTEDKLQNIDYNIHAMTKIYQDSVAKFNGNTAFAMLDSVVGMDLVTLVVANNASDSNLTFDDYCKNYGVKDITDDLEKLNNNSLEIYLSGLNGTVLEKYKNTIAWLRNSGYNSQTFKVADILKGLESNYLGVTSENVVIKENDNQDGSLRVIYDMGTNTFTSSVPHEYNSEARTGQNR